MQYNFCVHGHLYVGANGSRYRQCKTCKARRNKFLYRNNPDYRERQKTQALQRYYASGAPA